MKKPFVVATLLIVVMLVLGASILVFLNSDKPTANSTVIHYTYTVVNTYPHDTNAFTEGLVYSDGFLYESTGLYGSSSLRRVNLTTGNVLQEVALPSQYFGEGITIVNNTIIQSNMAVTYRLRLRQNHFYFAGKFYLSNGGLGLDLRRQTANHE